MRNIRASLRDLRNPFLLAVACTSAIFGACSHTPPLPRHPQAALALDRLMSGDPTLQSEAKVELVSLGAGAMPDLRDQFSIATAEQRRIIAEAVGTIGSPQEIVVEVFTMAARDPSPAVRQVVAFRSAAYPHLQRELSPSLQYLMWDAAPEIQAAAITTLSEFSSLYTLSEANLSTFMKSPSPVVVAAAVTAALRRPEPSLRQEALEALPNLIGEIMNRSPLIRAAVIIAIGKYGSAAAPAVLPLVGSLENDPVPEIRLHAALALMRIKTKSAIAAATPTLQEFANSSDPVLALPAQRMLQQEFPH